MSFYYAYNTANAELGLPQRKKPAKPKVPGRAAVKINQSPIKVGRINPELVEKAKKAAIKAQRVVELTGSAMYRTTRVFHSDAFVAERMKYLLETWGFGGVRVNIDGTATLLNHEFNFTILVNANAEHSDQQIQQWIESALGSDFYNFQTRVRAGSSNNAPPPRSPSPSSPPPNSNPNPNGAPPPEQKDDFFTTLAKAFGFGAGSALGTQGAWSLPVLLGVGIVGILILKD